MVCCMQIREFGEFSVRIHCLCVRTYIHRSEHERHAVQCPYIRGEYTDNVPVEETEGACPAYHWTHGKREGQGEEGDRIVCLGTSLGTELVAVGTERGRVVLLDVANGMLIIVCVYVVNSETYAVIIANLHEQVRSLPLKQPLYPFYWGGFSQA